jgi:hypothetical protein
MGFNWRNLLGKVVDNVSNYIDTRTTTKKNAEKRPDHRPRYLNNSDVLENSLDVRQNNWNSDTMLKAWPDGIPKPGTTPEFENTSTPSATLPGLTPEERALAAVYNFSETGLTADSPKKEQDAVNSLMFGFHRAGKVNPENRDLTGLPFKEVLSFQKRMFDQGLCRKVPGTGQTSCAIGGLQATYPETYWKAVGFNDDTPWTTDNLNLLAVRGYAAKQGGVDAERLKREGLSDDVLHDLSKVWASFPKKGGGSYYAGQPAKKPGVLRTIYENSLKSTY